MADKHLELRPHHIRGEQDVWWYEEPKGMCFVVRFPTETKQFTIPWKTVRNAVARKDHP